MAEALALLGAATAAAQFAEIGFKVVYKCSVLVKESREYPEFLQRTRTQIHHLISLAKVAAENTDTSQVVTSSEVQPATSENQQRQFVNDQHSVQLEAIWKDCSHQAEIIDTALQSMKQEVEGRGGIVGQWKKLRLHPLIQTIQKALGELERCKATLGLYLGNESLSRMGHMHHDVASINDKFVHLEEFLSHMFEEYHKKTENVVLDAIQQAQTAESSDLKTYNIQEKSSNPQRNTQRNEASMVVPYPENQGRNLNNANLSFPRKRRKDVIDNSNIFFSYFKRVEWSKMLTLAGNTVILQFGSLSKKPFASATEDDKNKFLNCYLRLRTAWLFDLVEFNFSFQQYPCAPSVQVSLKALTRVKSLPLETFFKDIYGARFPRNKPLQKTVIPSEEEQTRLFTVARKLLLKRFYAGDASPSYTNANGETLLHFQTRLYKPGYKVFFTKMIELLTSMGVGTEVVDDELQTAQNILCNKILRSEDPPSGTSRTFADEPPLPWTGYSELRYMGASKILQCIQLWPESIIDTGYERIYDIVLRKSIDDLQDFRAQEDLDTMRRGQSIFPLHFAAAASWSEGVKTLISMGYPKFQEDINGRTPLDIAIEVKCTPAVEFLLAGDCLDFLAASEPSLPREFRKAAESDDSDLHYIVIKCLLRHKFLLPRFLPYHWLAYAFWYNNFENGTKFIQRLFVAGFQDIDAYNDYGYTPLMVACGNGNTMMASFLLEHGADPYKCHERVDLRAVHFFCYSRSISLDGGLYGGTITPRFKDVERRLLKTALDTPVDIGSRCRCSPDGLSPIIILFQSWNYSFRNIANRKRIFESFIETIDPSFADRKKYWRAFVVGETFNRLGMTHTCIKLENRIRSFPDNERIKIEDEEEGLFSELEEIVARFDLYSENFGDDLSRCVDDFFDDLDGDIRVACRFERHSWLYSIYTVFDDGLLGEYSFEGDFVSTRGRLMRYGYKEIVKEESMLRLLFS
ncbi:uncharacterized protein TRUGW13939_11127 [Talaromyces rugulosus]|uniref:Uncharacterized protein n=1 Tax=Talaromyces rugulosus TaxID=121627 RepID=A0A7H8REK8_TALRU|nr:uncharacterized protein TRUGW13939_11127 [Talaromyces rugulosus]QKX63955.1 hypothetical protein TRUGW13939_11127 [Talaromyces rugulosus]